MKVSERAQEILEKYWIENKEKKRKWSLDIIPGDPVVDELIGKNIAVRYGHALRLTERGWSESENCVRRHRLAECLVADVLYVKPSKIHETGCKLEHILQEDVEENICILLGHPRHCPHGRPIPPGRCCKDPKARLRTLVTPLSECDPKDKGKIVFFKTDKKAILNKLTSMGILPGLKFRLLSNKPAYLFSIGHSQFAVDRDLAEKIYVRIIK